MPTAPPQPGARQHSVSRFTAWLAEEGELPTDPFLGMTAPKLDTAGVEPVRVKPGDAGDRRPTQGAAARLPAREGPATSGFAVLQCQVRRWLRSGPGPTPRWRGPCASRGRSPARRSRARNLVASSKKREIRPPSRTVSRESVSRRGMKTPVRVPSMPSHSTAIRCAAFSVVTPTIAGSPLGRRLPRRMRQILSYRPPVDELRPQARRQDPGRGRGVDPVVDEQATFDVARDLGEPHTPTAALNAEPRP